MKSVNIYLSNDKKIMKVLNSEDGEELGFNIFNITEAECLCEMDIVCIICAPTLSKNKEKEK